MPQFTVWFASNYRPIVSGRDQAAWDRLKLLPFLVRFEEDEQDKALPKKLREELPGVLAWAVRGAVHWYEHGLTEAAEVTAATQAYRNEMDIVARFLSDTTERSEGYSVTAKALFDAYANWCAENGEEKANKKQLGTTLDEMGIKRDKIKNRWYRLGIALTADYEDCTGETP